MHPRPRTTILALTLALVFGCLIMQTTRSCNVVTSNVLAPFCSAEQIAPTDILSNHLHQAVMPNPIILMVLVTLLLLGHDRHFVKLDPKILARKKWLHPLLPRGWPPAQKFLPRLCAVRDP